MLGSVQRDGKLLMFALDFRLANLHGAFRSFVKIDRFEGNLILPRDMTTRCETDGKKLPAQPPEGSFSLFRCLPEGEGASSTWEPMGAGWSWLIPIQPLRKRLKKKTNESNLVTVKLLSEDVSFLQGRSVVSKETRFSRRSAR